jgi:hypothetical protein
VRRRAGLTLLHLLTLRVAEAIGGARVHRLDFPRFGGRRLPGGFVIFCLLNGHDRVLQGLLDIGSRWRVDGDKTPTFILSDDAV